MKKILTLLLCFIMIFSLVGCKSNDNEMNKISEENYQNSKYYEGALSDNAIKLNDEKIKFDLSWQSKLLDGSNYDLDIVAFMLDSANICYETEGFVFYNQPNSFDNSIKLSADIKESDTNSSEKLEINLKEVDEKTVKIPVLVCRYYDDSYDISKLSSVNLVISNENSELKQFEVQAKGAAIEICSLFRMEDGWYIDTVNKVYDEDLMYITSLYGLNVSG